jgi:hypothetical protein
MPKIKTFEEACKFQKLDPKKMLPDVKVFPKQHQTALLALAQLIIIAEVLNSDEKGNTWKPNWKDSSERKYYPWFDLSSGSGLSYGAFDFRNSGSIVGSRLCFKSMELAEYAGKKFKKLYQDYFLLN